MSERVFFRFAFLLFTFVAKSFYCGSYLTTTNKYSKVGIKVATVVEAVYAPQLLMVESSALRLRHNTHLTIGNCGIATTRG